MERLPVGDSTLTRRVLKRCRDAGIPFKKVTSAVKIGRSKYGTKIDAYLVPKEILGEERIHRTVELESIRERETAERSKRLAELRKRQIDEVAGKFKTLTSETVERLVDSGRPIYSDDEVGYQFQVGTKSYWHGLGFSVKGDPTGHLVRGEDVFDTYSSRQLELRSSRMTVEGLKRKWLKKYGTEELVLAQAIRFANRLQKVKKVDAFYALKNRWIVQNQDKLTEGRLTRIESKTCRKCNGSGKYTLLRDCHKCSGTGIYTSNKLYEHEFLIGDTRFRFHAYIVPKLVLAQTEPCDDAKSAFGRPFDSDEMPVPNQSVIIQLIQVLMPTAEKLGCCTVLERSRNPETSGCLTLLSTTPAIVGQSPHNDMHSFHLT